MIKFLFKGIMGDKNRSLLPIIIITIGVALTVLLSGYINALWAILSTKMHVLIQGTLK